MRDIDFIEMNLESSVEFKRVSPNPPGAFGESQCVYLCVNYDGNLVAIIKGVGVLEIYSSGVLCARVDTNAKTVVGTWVCINGTRTWILLLGFGNGDFWVLTADGEVLFRQSVAESSISRIRLTFESDGTQIILLLLDNGIFLCMDANKLKQCFLYEGEFEFTKLACPIDFANDITSIDIDPEKARRYIVVGADPMIVSCFKPISLQPSTVSIAKNVAAAVISFASSFLFASPPPKLTAEICDVPATATSIHRSICDTTRILSSIALSPCRRFAAVSDTFGRVMLLDTAQFVFVRMWKGYRDAELAWFQNPNGVNPLLAIHAPARGLLEVWRTPNGPRVGARSIEPGSIVSFSVNAVGATIMPRVFLTLPSKGLYCLTISRQLDISLFLPPVLTPVSKGLDMHVIEQLIFTIQGCEAPNEELLESLALFEVHTIDDIERLLMIVFPVFMVSFPVRELHAGSSICLLNQLLAWVDDYELLGCSSSRLTQIRFQIQAALSLVAVFLQCDGPLAFPEYLRYFNSVSSSDNHFFTLKPACGIVKLTVFASFLFDSIDESPMESIVCSLLSLGLNPRDLLELFHLWLLVPGNQSHFGLLTVDFANPQPPEIAFWLTSEDDDPFFKGCLSVLSNIDRVFPLKNESSKFLVNLDAWHALSGTYYSKLVHSVIDVQSKLSLSRITWKLFRLAYFYNVTGELLLPSGCFTIIGIESSYPLARIYAMKVVLDDIDRTKKDELILDELVELSNPESLNINHLMLFAASEYLMEFTNDSSSATFSKALSLLKPLVDSGNSCAAGLTLQIFDNHVSPSIISIFQGGSVQDKQAVCIYRAEAVLRLLWTSYTMSQGDNGVGDFSEILCWPPESLADLSHCTNEFQTRIVKLTRAHFKSTLEGMLLVIRCITIGLETGISPLPLRSIFPGFSCTLSSTIAITSDSNIVSSFVMDVWKTLGVRALSRVLDLARDLRIDRDELKLKFAYELYSRGEDTTADDIVHSVASPAAATLILNVSERRIKIILSLLQKESEFNDLTAKLLLASIPLPPPEPSLGTLQERQQVSDFKTSLSRIDVMVKRALAYSPSGVDEVRLQKVHLVTGAFLQELERIDCI